MPKVEKNKSKNVAKPKDKFVQPGIKALLYSTDDRYGKQYLKTLNFLFANSCFVCQGSLSKFSMRCVECSQQYNFCSLKCSKTRDLIYPQNGTCCVFCVRQRSDKTSTLLKWLGVEKKNQVQPNAEQKAVK